MFGKKKADHDAPGAAAGVASTSSNAPDLTGVLNDDQYDALRIELRGSGVRAKAKVTGVTLGGTVGYEGCAWRTALEVYPPGGDPFDTEIALLSIAYDEEFQPWNIGDVTTVVFDPADHSRVVFLPPGEAPTIRWKVPAVCPNCGAQVDQAAQSMADQPVCKFCHEPLPSEPRY